jgi:hypothetical protein
MFFLSADDGRDLSGIFQRRPHQSGISPIRRCRYFRQQPFPTPIARMVAERRFAHLIREAAAAGVRVEIREGR